MKIIPRRAWGARPPKGFTHVTWPSGVDLWVHHTTGGTPPISASQAYESTVVRSIQAFHMDTRGWNDCGYSYLIAPSGRVYEGRGKNVQGAHSPGKNHEPSVALIGDYSDDAPTDQQHRAVYELKAHLGAGRLRGHRENTQTTCPGDAAMDKIVKGDPPKAPVKKLTLRQRLIRGFRLAGFGGKSAKKAADKYLGG